MEQAREARSRIDAFLASSEISTLTKNKLKHSIEIVRQAAAQFPLNELAMSFNGGKDCMLMFVIVLYVLDSPPPVIYVRNERSFPELDDFVTDCTEKYALDLTVKIVGMKQGFEEYLEVHPEKKAVFVGIRRQDPYAAALEYIQPTDHGWPAFTRVQPVLDWEYHEVWQFLLHCKIPYCSLYDKGYTSLGSMDKTIPNPALKTSEGYKPAYMLIDETLERSGRTK